MTVYLLMMLFVFHSTTVSHKFYGRKRHVKSAINPLPLAEQGVRNIETRPVQHQQKTKKSKAPKVNQALAKELEKIDEEFEKRRSAYQAIFPFPKSNLHNAYAVISSQLGKTQSVEFVYLRVSEAPACWQCTAQTSWPVDAKFTSRAASKSEAAHRASLLTLQWLQSQGKVNPKGEVEVKTRMSQQQAGKHTPVAEIQLSSSSLKEIEDIVDKYYKVAVKPQDGLNVEEMNVPQDPNATMIQAFDVDDADLEIDSLPLVREKSLFPRVADRRDQELFRRYERLKTRRDEFSAALPIDKFKDEILNLVNASRVVVIKGQPGCGKSTQVPQYLMELHAAQCAATDCNIVVTQPRRISAIALADRVAHERSEQVGDVVGYHVRLNAKHPKYRDGFILFCSTGLLVNKMIGDPGLSGATHVVVDEAHERDIQLDLLLLLLKRALDINPSLKVIIMSATINAELFTKYFGDCPSLSIPGFTFPVEHHFLDGEMRSVLQRRGVKFEAEDVDNPVVNIEAVVAMVTWIDENKPPGAILVFLPGWMEIRTVMEELEVLAGWNHFMVVPAHSKLSSEDQRKIFHKCQDGRRKVILATNIAETSLTIDDVVYVVDTGTVKEERVDLKSGLVCLDNQWASQANVRQRRGRAGRVKPGFSYHLFTEAKFNSLDQFPLPEVHRIPLTRTVLDVKMHTKDEEVKAFLSALPDPPSVQAVDQAVRVLQEMGALDHEADLTALGRRIYRLPLQPHLSKAIVHACLFKCVNPVLTIATLLASDTVMFENSLGGKRQLRLFKQAYSPSSDHLASERLYHQWQDLLWSNPSEAQAHCRQNGLVYKALLRTSDLDRLHAELLKATKLIPAEENVNDLQSSFNKFSPHDELIKGVMLSGLGNILVSYKPPRARGLVMRTSDGSTAVISNESVNSKFKELPSPFLTYFKSMSSTERRAIIVHDTSLLSPVSVVLFLPGVVTLKNMDGLRSGQSVISIQAPKPISIIVDQKEGEQLLHLRQVVWNVLEYLVENEGEPKDVEQYEAICQFREELVHVLANLTTEQGANIDYTESGELRTEPPIGYSHLRHG